MSPDPAVQLRLATAGDAAFIVEMARYASVIEDWPLPDVKSDDVHDLLPAVGEVPIVAVDALFARCAGTVTALCANVHVRNRAANLYQRKGFEQVGQGRGPLGVAMHKDL